MITPGRALGHHRDSAPDSGATGVRAQEQGCALPGARGALGPHRLRGSGCGLHGPRAHIHPGATLRTHWPPRHAASPLPTCSTLMLWFWKIMRSSCEARSHCRWSWLQSPPRRVRMSCVCWAGVRLLSKACAKGSGEGPRGTFPALQLPRLRSVGPGTGVRQGHCSYPEVERMPGPQTCRDPRGPPPQPPTTLATGCPALEIALGTGGVSSFVQGPVMTRVQGSSPCSRKGCASCLHAPVVRLRPPRQALPCPARLPSLPLPGHKASSS